ncbi:hypothetical protein ACNI0M_22700, partial [Escherichia coli]
QMLHLHSAISPYLSGGNCNISVNLHTICEQSMAFCCAGSASLAAVVYAFITDLINYHILRILLICNISLTISG